MKKFTFRVSIPPTKEIVKFIKICSKTEQEAVNILISKLPNDCELCSFKIVKEEK